MVERREIRRVLIANRGEVAVRILRTCHRLGIEAVVAVSEADRSSLAADLADQTVCIGPPGVRDSYLNQQSILAAALSRGCDALHPGYGFLSEEASFAALCVENGVTFIGPSPAMLELFGDKVTARETATAAGVPVVQGSGPLGTAVEAVVAASAIGYPVLLKAVHGGGGRGMRVARDEDELVPAYALGSAEALAAFGNGEMFLEQWVSRGRHVEVQIVADAEGNVLYLGDRDCSVQRRYQKLVEEAPAPGLSLSLQGRVRDAAVRLARSVGYSSIGTVEFLIDCDRDEFFFLEVNPRLQVEHGVTELITGIDLVALQLKVASGDRLGIVQQDVRLTGSGLECRINAEDPTQGFQPSPGRLSMWRQPGGPGVRIDTHCYQDYVVPPYYDSLLAKVMTYAASRDEAIECMAEALDSFRIEGVKSTVQLVRSIVTSAAFRNVDVTTRWLDGALDPGAGSVREETTSGDGIGTEGINNDAAWLDSQRSGKAR